MKVQDESKQRPQPASDGAAATVDNEAGQSEFGAEAVAQLVPHVPDSVIESDHMSTMPGTTEYIGVALFADISGFTSLCESYADMATTDATCGTDKLQATLNEYIGKIVDVIVKNGGDVLKFAGDAILASWRCSDTGYNAKAILTKAIKCSLAIQKTCDNFMTGVGILLRVKIALAVGTMCITYVGLPEAKQFDLSGSAVDDVGKTEKHATPGTVILSQLAWVNCDHRLFKGEEIDGGKYFLTTENSMIPVDSQQFTVGHGLVNAFTELFSSQQQGAGHASAAANSQWNGKAVICPLYDALMEKCVDYRVDIPLALMMDENEDQRMPATSYAANIPLKKTKKKEKENKNAKTKFDRVTMTINLDKAEVGDLRAYVPKPVLDKLDNGQDLQWLSEMREVSVLFINMKLPDEKSDAAHALQKAFEVIYEATKQLKGNLNKVFGFDKGCTFVVIFGLPGDKYEDDAARALRCGHRVYEALQAVQDITDEGIGVTTGKAFCGVVGHKDRHEYTVIGRKVNMAARLMMNYPGKLTCDSETYAAAKTKLRTEDFVTQPFKELKGIKDPGVVREYIKNLKRETDDGESFDFPIVGRVQEISRCRRCLSQVKATCTTGQLIIVQGEAGVGKTRLLEEIMDVAEEQAFKILQLDLDMSRAHEPYHVISTFIKLVLNFNDEMTSSEKEARLYEAAGSSEDMKERLAFLNELIGTNIAPSDRLMAMPEAEAKLAAQQLVTELVKVVSTADQPILFAVDNAHYMDPLSWEFIGDLVRGSPVVMMLALRKFSLANPAPCRRATDVLNDQRHEVITLGGLKLGLMADLACQLLAVKEIPKRLDEVLREKSNGMPSFCEQMIKDMVAMEAIRVLPKRQLMASQRRAPKHQGRRQSTVSSPDYELANNVTGSDERRQSVSSGRGMRFSLPLNETAESQVPAGQTFGGDNKRPQTSEGAKRDSLDSDALPLPWTVKYNPGDYVVASRTAVPEGVASVCILNPAVDLHEVLVPNSVKDMVIARFDRMTPNQQLVLKCASILGTQFTRALLKAIVPKSNTSAFDVTVHNLSKDNILQCASILHGHSQPASYRQHHHHHHHHHTVVTACSSNVYCGCYADEGLQLVNLSQARHHDDGIKRTCLSLQFTHAYVQEAAYALWLEDQRKSLHERAAIYLESQTTKCTACGGNASLPSANHSRQGGTATSNNNNTADCRQQGFNPGLVARPALTARGSTWRRSSSKPRASLAWSSSAELAKDGKGGHRKGSIGLTRRPAMRQAGTDQRGETRGDDIGKALVDMAVLLMRPAVDQGRRRSLFAWNRDNKVVPETSAMAKTLLADFKKSINNDAFLPGVLQPGPRGQRGATGRHPTVATAKIDISRCRCAHILASVYTQLARHWRMASNQLKTSRYSTEAAAALLAIGRADEATAYLQDARTLIDGAKSDKSEMNFIVTSEEKARVDNLMGQAMLAKGQNDEALRHLYKAMKRLGSTQPTTRLGVWRRTTTAAMVQSLHRRMPGVFVDTSGENSARLTEQAKCLCYIATAFQRTGDNARLFMAALEELNAAEEASDDWVELMYAYSTIIECCRLTARYSLGKFYERVAKERLRQGRCDVDHAGSIGQFHCVSLAFHMANNNVTEAVEQGFKALEVAVSVNDVRLKGMVIPLLVKGLLLTARMQASQEVLAQLKEACRQLNETSLEALYYCCCLDLILEAGSPLERFSSCYAFAMKYKSSSTRHNPGPARYYMEICLALWFARKETWSEALAHVRAAEGMDHSHLDNATRDHAQAKIAEIDLLYLRGHITETSAQLRSGKSLKALQRLCRRSAGVLLPRLYHLQAYSALLRHKISKASLLLEDCTVASQLTGVSLEAERAGLSRRVWFTNYNPNAYDDYDDNVKFALPPQ